MIAYVFPGQGSQFPGMGKDIYESDNKAKQLFEEANQILGFNLANVMFDGTAEELKSTKYAQPAIFCHSVICYLIKDNLSPDAVAGHSLGEFSALVAAGVLSFEAGLKLVQIRANAMQKACDLADGTMAAIVGLDDEIVEEVCHAVQGTVVAANYNCPGQLVISGERDAVIKSCDILKGKGARRALMLPVGGAFHSPLMQPARDELAEAIGKAAFSNPICPIFQNVDGQAHTDALKIKDNLVQQLTSSVLWTQTMKNLKENGLSEVVEVGGNGKVISGMFKKLDRSIVTRPLND